MSNRVDFTDFDVKYVGLKLGKHQFQYKIDSLFFSKFQDALVDNVDINLNFTLDKQSDRLFLMDFEFSGKIGLACDRCLQEFDFPVNHTNRMVLKIENQAKESDDDVIFLSVNEFKINIAGYVYEFVSLLLPMSKNCDLVQKKCDQNMVKLINNYSGSKSKVESDNNWEILKNLKKN